MANVMSPEVLERHAAILDRSPDRARITASARALATSDDPLALLTLGQHLRSAGFLNRLDDTSQPSSDIENFAVVFGELALHPTESSARLCELLYLEPDFAAIPIRLNFLLAALAAYSPVSEAGAAVFRQTSAEGFAEVNGPLLTRNQSPLAIRVFEEIVAGDWLETRVKVEILHRSVLPHRTDIPVLAACMRLLKAGLPPPVRDAVVETLYDYRPANWFGPVRQALKPPPWETASTEVLRVFVGLADLLPGLGVEDSLLSTVRATVGTIQAILSARLR